MVKLALLLLLTGANSKISVKARDVPDDGGGRTQVIVELDSSFIGDIMRITRIEDNGVKKDIYVGEIKDTVIKLGDRELSDTMPVRYHVLVNTKTGQFVAQSVSNSVIPKASLFNKKKLFLLFLAIFYITILLSYMTKARKGQELYLRPIAGLAEVYNAIGRATEMGRPILFSPGLLGVTDVSTIAALNILAYITKKVAAYETRIIVPVYDPIVYTVAREVVKDAYTAAGRPDLFKNEDVFFLTQRQFAYAAGVSGIMVREKTATNFFMGYFFAESLILAETGAATGAIQIAGTDAISQLPFFVTACDYTLMGEELYAAGAYLAKDPRLTATIKGQDIMKAVLVGFLLLLTIVALVPELSAKVDAIKPYVVGK